MSLSRDMHNLLQEMTWIAPTQQNIAFAEYTYQARRTRVGESSHGKDINMFTWQHGTGKRRILLYGFPHPDEPMGTAALLWLAQKLEEKDPRIPEGQWSLVFSPDPDLETYNQRWTGGKTIEDLVYGSWRPDRLRHEVDYGFGVDWGIFYLPENYRGIRDCLEGICWHDEGDCPQGPGGALPESVAIAQAIRTSRPTLVVSLHDTHSGGAYSFRLFKPTKEERQQHADLLNRIGTPRHLGQRIDSGLPWHPDSPDLIREPTIAKKQKKLLKRGFEEGEQYLLPVSCAMYLEVYHPQTDFLVPEAGHFTHPDFGNTQSLAENVTVFGKHIITKQGKGRYALYGEIRMPDGTQEEVLWHMRPRRKDDILGKHTVQMTRGMLGVEAVLFRRWAMQKSDKIWNDIPAGQKTRSSSYVRNRDGIAVPGSRVNDKSLRYFRTVEIYMRQATRAHAADFRWRWSIHTAIRLGYLHTFLGDIGGHVKEQQELEKTITQLLDILPSSMRTANGRIMGMQSQLARAFLLLGEDDNV